ncbi:MAG: glycosyltransferase family 2 protein [Methanobrevibacter sp.]|uniref:glycosyltransferase family 2 protein n=1 Tax=Methanobrevibacter sp. TaxID=66852 RepID=UPI0026E0B41D|nr:glycosyltransferase family 2 protein [Methanobrevibacter sp.]MDO5848666.1 glycosyltransferase family 2 protein [Methanobrevibacter sp.]
MISTVELKDGVSVIVPTSNKEDNIKPLLNSLEEQTLDNELFEIIFIQDKGNSKLIEEFKSKNPEINIILANSEPGLSQAYNEGISLAGREYTTFIDYKDYISPKYLEMLFKNAKNNRIVIPTLMDVNEETGEVRNTYFTSPSLEKGGLIKNPFSNKLSGTIHIPMKLIPTVSIKYTSFNTNNNEDLQYYVKLYSRHDFEFYILDKNDEAFYYKLLEKPNYENNIRKPLENIKEFNKQLSSTANEELIKSLIDSQILFMNKYLFEYPEDLEKVMLEVYDYEFKYFSYKLLNENPSNINKPINELVISYAFAPTSTTSSNDVAKKILKSKENVDVICGTLFNEPKDESMAKIVEEYVDKKMLVDLDDYHFYSGGKKFGKEGLKILNEQPTYDNIYSCVQFVPAHYLGYLYKISHDTFWTAEFSDPIIRHFNAGLMSSPINDQDLVDEINETIPDGFDKVKVTDTVNEIIEYITYIFADRIIFTNEKQMELMVNDFPKLKEMVIEKSITKRHPTLEEKYYYIGKSDYELDDDYVNFAYFGVLYENRSFEEFINGFDSLPDEYKEKFRLHVFSPDREIFEEVLSEELLEKTVINDPINYFEFLNLTTKMDILLVEDSTVAGLYDFNPYLPSKVSDYKGTNVDIWAVCDEDSIMSHMAEIKYKSSMNNINSAKSVLNQIMSDKLGEKINNDDLTDEELFKYYKVRHSHLVTKLSQLNNIKNNEISQKNSLLQEKNKLSSEKKALLAEKEKWKKEKEDLIKERNALKSQNTFYEARIEEYKNYTEYLRKWMRPRFVFTALKKVRSLYRKLKN